MHTPAGSARASYWTLSLGVAGLLGGCAVEPDSDASAEGERAAEVISVNGTSNNGIALTGTSVAGVALTGLTVNAIFVSAATMSGKPLGVVSVAETQLQATSSTGTRLVGAAMVGATLQGQLSNSGTIALHVDSSALLPAPNADVRVYAISYATSTGARPLCVGANGANEAIVFPGTWNLVSVRHQWDTNQFAVSCRGATFAKCEEMGYKGDGLLDSYHQACTRALRADYCGDGTSHTVNGTQINLSDKLGLQIDNQAWAIESNWTPDGATCIGKGRVATSLVVPNVPSCMALRALVPCVTSSWPTGVLLRTEVNK